MQRRQGSSPTATEIAEYFVKHISKPSGYTWKHGVVEYGAAAGLYAWTLVRRIDEYDVDVLVRLEANKKGLLSFTWINPNLKPFNYSTPSVKTLEQAAEYCKLFNDAYAKQSGDGDGDGDDLRIMYDTLTDMHSRVAKLEAGLGVPTVTTATKRYTKEELDEMSLKEVIDAGVRELPVLHKEAAEDKRKRLHRTGTGVKMDITTALEKQYEAYMDVFVDRVWPDYEEFLSRKNQILATPPREYSRRTLKELDDLLPTGLLFDHWSVATGEREPVSHTDALQELRKAVKEALGMERGDWT